MIGRLGYESGLGGQAVKDWLPDRARGRGDAVVPQALEGGAEYALVIECAAEDTPRIIVLQFGVRHDRHIAERDRPVNLQQRQLAEIDPPNSKLSCHTHGRSDLPQVVAEAALPVVNIERLDLTFEM